MRYVSSSHTSYIAQHETLDCLGSTKNKLTALARGIISCCLPCCATSSRAEVEGGTEMEAVLLPDPNPTMTQLLRQVPATGFPILVYDVENRGYNPPRLPECNEELGRSPVSTEAAAASRESSVFSEDVKEFVVPPQADSSAQTEEPGAIGRTALDTEEGAPRGVHLTTQVDPSTPPEEEEVSLGWTWADFGGALVSALHALSVRGGSEE